MSKEIFDQSREYTRKTIEVAAGIRVISVARCSDSSESGLDCLYLVSKRGTELVDSSPYFIDLEDAVVEEDKIVIKWKKQEKHYKLKRGVYDETYQYHEEVVEPRKCERRIPVL